jgi:hypothetical protein
MAGKKIKQWSWFVLLYIAGLLIVGIAVYLLKWIVDLL